MKLFSRIYGSLLGGAVGDALGFPAEGHHYKAILKRWGQVDRLMTRPDCTHFHPPVTMPVYTDDTVMRHMVCQVLIESQGRPTSVDVARVWKEHIKDFNDWRWWNNTRIVGMKLSMGWPQADLRQIGRDSIPCNDAAMIIAPVGLLHAGNPDLAAYQALEMSGVWQNGYSRDCAAAMAAAHAVAAAPRATLDTIVAEAMRWSSDFAPYVERTVALAQKSSDTKEFTVKYYEQYVPGPLEEYWSCIGRAFGPDDPWCFNADPLEVCSLGIGMFYVTKGDTKQAMIGGASFGRDCDTIAGIAGSLSGALYGAETVPMDWAQELMRYCPDPDIKVLAERLTMLAAEKNRALTEELRQVGQWLE